MTGHAPDELKGVFGDYDRIFAQLLGGHGLTFEAFDVENGIFPDGPDTCDGWLITGSRHGAYEDHPWIPSLEDLIRQIRDARRPLVGICFGHQIIAQALGGRVEKFSGGWVVGRTEYKMGDDTIALNAWHQDQVVGLPDGAEVLATNALCENAIVAYGPKILSVQAHPEYDGRFFAGLATFRGRGVVPDDQIATALSTLTEPTDNATIATRLVDVLKTGAQA